MTHYIACKPTGANLIMCTLVQIFSRFAYLYFDTLFCGLFRQGL